MTNWYRAGIVDVVSASKSIVGAGTLWEDQVAAGDLFTLDGDHFYEIETITDDTHIVLKTNYLESSGDDQSYAIIRNFASTTNATLAARLAELLNRWHTREDEWYAWHNGTRTGGTNHDGRYPFTDAAGDVILIACPDKMDALNGFTYIAYASSDAGANFTLNHDPNLDFIAFLTVAEEIETPVASDFTGLWKKYQGDRSFTYIAYASDANGTDFTLTFNADLHYIAIKATTVAIPSPVVTDFTGLWKNYKGTTGAGLNILGEYATLGALESAHPTGSLGDAYLLVDGSLCVWTGSAWFNAGNIQGDNAYVYVAYASADDGTDFTTTFDADLNYIAILATDTAISAPAVGDFSGLWKNYKGATGEAGDDAYIYIAYASASDGTDFTMTFNAALDYIAVKNTTSPIANPAVGDFTGLWFNYKGDKGDQGDASTVPGPQGDKGDKGDQGDASTVPGPQGDKGDPGDGNVNGPASATNENIAVFDQATGKLLKDSGVGIASLAPKANPAFTGTFDLAAATELTIDSGAVTVTQAKHRINTTGGAGSSDLVTINGGSVGRLLLIRANTAGKTVVVKSTGNILTGGSDITLDSTSKYVLFVYDSALSKWVVVGGGGSASVGFAWSTVTGATNAVTQNGYACNTAGGAFALTLPGSPAVGAVVAITDAAGTFDTLNLTIGRNSLKIMGLAEDLVVSTKYAAFSLVYASAALGWRIA